MPNNRDFYIKFGIGLFIMLAATFLRIHGLIEDDTLAIILPCMLNFFLGLYSSPD